MEKVREIVSEINEVKTTREPSQSHSTQLVWRRVVRLFLSGLVVCALGLGLAGCEPLENGRTSISIDANGRLQLGLCRSMDVREIRVSVDDARRQELSSVKWKGYSAMSQGVSMSFDGMGEFPLVDLVPTSASQQLYIHVYLYERPYEVGMTAWGVFLVDPGELQTGDWLLPNGDRSDTVCGGYE